MKNFNILLYHGIIPDNYNPGYRNKSGKHIKQSDFFRQMEYISKNKNLLSMLEIEKYIYEKKPVPNNSVAVTFDDGFLNNYCVAWPIIEKFKIPTTIYLATGFIGKEKKIWTDLLENFFMNIKNETLIFSSKNFNVDFKFYNFEERVKKFLETKKILKNIPENEKSKILNYIEKNNTNNDSEHSILYKFMDWNQVNEMNSSELIDFGAHTVDHVSLTKVSKDIMKMQIVKSLESIKKNINSSSTLFSYPEGQESDFNLDIINFLKSINIKHSPSAIDGTNPAIGVNPYKLKRIMVGFEGRPFPYKIGESLGNF